jgi:hypothetical protein
LITEDVGDLWEGWMRQVDQLLTDEQLLELVYEALARRWTHSRTHGRKGTPADVVLRLLVLKHVVAARFISPPRSHGDSRHLESVVSDNAPG